MKLALAIIPDNKDMQWPYDYKELQISADIPQMR